MLKNLLNLFIQMASLKRIEKELIEFKKDKSFWPMDCIYIEQINEKDLFLYKAYIIGPDNTPI